MMTLSAIFGHIFGHTYTVWVAYTWGIGTHALLKWIVGLRYEIRGRDKWDGSPAIIACKHQSLLETSMIQVLAFDSGIILKRELMWIPFFGQALSALNVIGIDRGRGKKAIEQLVEGALACFEKGRNFMIFPEGTRTSAGSETKLKNGIVALYKHVNRPVIPITLNTGYFWARRSFLRYPGTVVYQYLDPIPPGLSEKDFIERLQQTLEKGTQALNQETHENLKPPLKPVMSKKKWWGILLTVGFTTALSLGYYGFQAEEKTLEKALISLQEQAKEKGFEVTYTSIQKKIRGLSYEIHLIDPALKVKIAPDIRLQNQGGSWIFGKNLWTFDQSVYLRSTGDISILSPHSDTPLAIIENIEGLYTGNTLHVTLKGFEGLGTSLKQLDLKHATGKTATSNRIQTRLLSLKIPGCPLPIDEISGDFLHPSPAIEGFDTSHLKAWAEAGGVWDMGKLVIILFPLNLALEGTLSLDESLKPVGAFTLKAKGVEKGLQRLEKANILPTWLATIFRFALSSHSHGAAENDTEEEYQLALTVQKGHVYLEGLPLFPLPELNW